MVWLFRIVLVWLVSAAAATAEPPDVHEVITLQFEAFADNDAEAAFALASPAIRSQFGTPENYVHMVKTAYPMVWRPSRIEFGRLVWRDGKVILPVLLTDQAGRHFIADYEMIGTSEGWGINGITIRAAEGAGV